MSMIKSNLLNYEYSIKLAVKVFEKYKITKKIIKLIYFKKIIK